MEELLFQNLKEYKPATVDSLKRRVVSIEQDFQAITLVPTICIMWGVNYYSGVSFNWLFWELHIDIKRGPQ